MSSTIQALVNYFWPGGTVGPYRGEGDNVGLTEAGVDVMLPGDTPIYALQPGYLSPYSTQYSAVEQTDSGPVDYYQHIDLATGLQPGSPITQGELLGYVKPEAGGTDTYTGTNGFGQSVTYVSSGSHLEFGSSASAQAAGFDVVAQTTDPAARLQAIQNALDSGNGDTPAADNPSTGSWSGALPSGSAPSTSSGLLAGLSLSPALVLGGIAVLLLIVLVA